MSNKLTFHAAGPEDAEILLRWNLHHAKTYETAMLDWQRVEALLDDKLRQELPRCRVICRNGEKIGYFSLQRRPEYLELDNFWVFPPFQCCGIGSQVLRYCKREAKKAGLPLRLFVFCKNERAVRLYERSGFRETTKFHQSRILMECRPE